MRYYRTLLGAIVCMGLSIGVKALTEAQDTKAPTAAAAIQAKKQPMKLLLGLIEENSELRACATIAKGSLQKSGQFTVGVQVCAYPKTKKEIASFFDQGYSLVAFLEYDHDTQNVSWRLYNAADTAMLKGKKTAVPARALREYAYSLADDLWSTLTHEPSSFATKIAYVKRIRNPKGTQQHHIYICNSDGTQERALFQVPGTYLGLYWNSNPDQPLLFCSEFARSNVRLISIDMYGRKKVVFNFPGTCVGISLAADSNRAIYCRSGDIWLYTFDATLRKGHHQVLIKNGGKNTAATLLEQGDVIFCSDAAMAHAGARTKGPHICRYSASDKSIKLITKDGYCVSPAYSPLLDKIVYSKRTKGTLQLWVYSIHRDRHEQLTYDSGNKIDACWSPCGRYIVFCHQEGKTSRIAVMHVDLKEQQFITPASAFCTSPAWSLK